MASKEGCMAKVPAQWFWPYGLGYLGLIRSRQSLDIHLGTLEPYLYLSYKPGLDL